MRNIVFYNHFDKETATHEVFMRVDDESKSFGKFDTFLEMIEALSTLMDQSLEKINYHPDYDTVTTNIFYSK